MKRFVFLAAAALCAPLSQAAAVDVVPLAYDAATFDQPPAVLKGACNINILTASDQRNNKETIGWIFTVPQEGAGDAVSWMNDGLANLKAYGYRVQRSATPVSGAVNVNVRLIRAYSWPANMRINGTVALDVGVVKADGSEELVKIRANGSKANMMGSQSEFVTALNYAANNAYGSLAANLQPHCASSKI
jgi:hypothetical protein